MFKPIELFIGLRYTRAKRRNHFISFISLLSMLGIAVGVTALITVLSVMNGFEKELRERILGVASHMTVTSYDGELDHWQELDQQLDHYPQIIGSAPYINGEGMLTNSRHVEGAMIRGVLPSREDQVSEVSSKMLAGSLDNLKAGEFGIVLGIELATALRVTLGDKVALVTPQANVTPIGLMPRMKRFTVVGIFKVGMYEFDHGLAILHINDAAKLLKMTSNVSGLRLKLDEMFDAPAFNKTLSSALPAHYFVSDWTYRHANFFRAVQTEKLVMFIILMLIVAVAAFNIVSTLVMVVTDKESDIAILRTLGATPSSIMGIFMVQGILIGLVGTALGILGGVSLALNVETLVPALERLLGVEFLAADVYYISKLPSDLDWNDVYLIGTLSFVLSVIATLYPAWRASRTQPAEALRYE